MRFIDVQIEREKMHALFANLTRETSGGWFDLVFRGSLEQCMAEGARLTADWAQVVDLETGEIMHSKARQLGGPALTEIPWAPGGGVGDMPVAFHMLLSQEEFSKLTLLGGEHWVRKCLKGVVPPPPLPTLRSSCDLLKALAGREMPTLIVGEQAGWAEQLHQEGLLEAEFTMESDPAGDWAVVLAITEQGHQTLAASRDPTGETRSAS